MMARRRSTTMSNAQSVATTTLDSISNRIFLANVCSWISSHSSACAPLRWEVLVFHSPNELGTPFIKRIVGLPGEAVQIKDGDIYINGALSPKPESLLRQTRVPIGNTIPIMVNNKTKFAFVTSDYWIYNGSKVNHMESVLLVDPPPETVLRRSVHYQSVGRNGIESPCRLGSDEYFVLGDNSAASNDSRFWPTPGVKRSRDDRADYLSAVGFRAVSRHTITALARLSELDIIR